MPPKWLTFTRMFQGTLALSLTLVFLFAIPCQSWAQGRKVHLNRASAAELQTLPGIGKVKAAQIIEHRTKHGPFRRVDDIIRIKGIGPKTFEKIRHLLTLNDDEAGALIGAEGDNGVLMGRINLNTATGAQLQALSGIGPKMAASILSFRQEHGLFTAVEDLTKIRGIGKKRLEQMQPFVTVYIDINTTDQATLQAVLQPPAQEQLAAQIIAYREEHGPFNSVPDLMNVPGITADILAPIFRFLTVDPLD